MAITLRAAGAWAAGTTSVAPTIPGGTAAGDIMLLHVVCKPFSATINTPTGWTLVPGTDGANGSTASGIDSGSVQQKTFFRLWVTGDGTPTVSITSGNVALGVIKSFQKASAAGWAHPLGAKGSDTSSGTGFSLTMDQDPGITNGDMLDAVSVIAGDNSTFGTPTMTATSATLAAVTESPATEGTTAGGNDLEATAGHSACTAGTATAAPVVGWTLSVAQTGGGALTRLREIVSDWIPPVQQPYFNRTLIVPSGLKMINRQLSSNGYYRSITLDQPASDLTDFPVLFSGTYTYLKTEANGGKVKNSNGYDIRFFSDAGLTTLLKFERVFWDGATGECEFWFKVPTLTNAAALVVYLAYGNPAIVTDQQDITGTWNSNYAGVWHLPNGSTLGLLDSTSNGFTLTNNNSATATAGKIDGCVDLVEASTQYLSKPFSGASALNTAAQTYSCWVKADSFPHAYNAAISRAQAGNFCQMFAKSTGKIAMYVQAVATISYDGTGTNTLSTGTWYYVVMTYDSSQGLIGYFNGASDGTAAANGNLTTGATVDTSIGYDLNTTPRGWDGQIDEVRISNVARSADWIAAEYSNQNDPANFYSIGGETGA